MLKPTVGPIIGHTTTNQTRIFLRGEWQKDALVFAGVRYRRIGDEQWNNGAFKQLTDLRDMSDVIVLHDLAADTEYEYQAGWLNPMNPVHTVETVQELPLQWPREIYRLRTQSNQITTPRAYIVGSCRYLNMTAGAPWAPHLGDRIFASISNLAQHASPSISAMLMTGDQVYVDDLNFIAPDREYQEILAKYRAAFSQPHISKLMSGTPTYMILDDHEIEDNWPANKSRTDEHLYNNAMAAYELYQASHSPAHQLDRQGQPRQPLKQYWYQFANGDIEWFVTDSRTRRNLAAHDRRILDIEQEQALCDWLIHSPARVKFVVTSVMFYPDRKRQGDDAWKAFPEQRLRLLETVRNHKIRNVVFVSGDVHGSLTSRLTHSTDPDFEVHTIVSSPLCNSKLLPYAKDSTFIIDQPLIRTETGDYRHELTGKVVSQDNFAHLIVDTEQIQVRYHDRDGHLLHSTHVPLR
ncbi:alkaline phosphatase D family protein [Pseudomonas sp. PCH199]|uniref:alkaline phosphatase D family protein n=1 Tax=unclassified Pseudomonas TaxID=196821 RepID=UPI000BD72FA5|nr:MULTISPECIES: alkaline phosphatase D family protein [unclassified Pseudomonas]MCW8276312.1 alkaline phosphatase D family protein [Pseudomonas sp. PCH199]PAM83696.1 phosphodiesterase [Pseudomonas sp. ERMR1:02]